MFSVECPEDLGPAPRCLGEQPLQGWHLALEFGAGLRKCRTEVADVVEWPGELPLELPDDVEASVFQPWLSETRPKVQ